MWPERLHLPLLSPILSVGKGSHHGNVNGTHRGCHMWLSQCLYHHAYAMLISCGGSLTSQKIICRTCDDLHPFSPTWKLCLCKKCSTFLHCGPTGKDKRHSGISGNGSCVASNALLCLFPLQGSTWGLTRVRALCAGLFFWGNMEGRNSGTPLPPCTAWT